MAEPRSARIAFAGTPAFAVPSLDALLRVGAEIPLVLTQPDRPSGRGRKLTASPVHSAAAALDLRVAQPTTLAGPESAADWGPRPDLMLVVAYGLLLPQWLLDWPIDGCVNLHASLLPRWRGAAPIQHAILAGDERTGVSLMHMVKRLDAGPVYAQRELAIAAGVTAGELHDALASLGAALLEETLLDIVAGGRRAEPQTEANATYAGKIQKADAVLDWGLPAIELARRVRAFNPWPVAEGRLSDGRRLRIWRASARPGGQNLAPGTIADVEGDGIDVVTGSGVLRLETVQAPGAREIPARAYLAANDLGGTSFV